VAALLDRLHEPRLRRFVVEHEPNLPDAVVQPLVELDEGRLVPDRAAQLVARDDLSRALDEEREDAARLRLDPYAGAVAGQRARAGVELEAAEAKACGARRLQPSVSVISQALSSLHPQVALSRSSAAIQIGAGEPGGSVAAAGWSRRTRRQRWIPSGK